MKPNYLTLRVRNAIERPSEPYKAADRIFRAASESPVLTNRVLTQYVVNTDLAVQERDRYRRIVTSWWGHKQCPLFDALRHAYALRDCAHLTNYDDWLPFSWLSDSRAVRRKVNVLTVADQIKHWQRIITCGAHSKHGTYGPQFLLSMQVHHHMKGWDQHVRNVAKLHVQDDCFISVELCQELIALQRMAMRLATSEGCL